MAKTAHSIFHALLYFAMGMSLGLAGINTGSRHFWLLMALFAILDISSHIKAKNYG